VGREHLALEPATMVGMLRLAGAGTVQAAISSASWVFLVRIVSGFGSAAVAGYTIAIRIVLFALLPSWGLANAAATMVGQGLGAGKPERAEKAVWTAAVYNLGFLGAVGALFIAFATPLIGAFAPDAEAAAYGVLCLRIVSAGFLFYAVGMVLTQAFNGAGDTFTPTLINLFCFWILEIPLAWTLAGPLGFGPSGAYAAVAAAFSVVAVVSGLLFRRGKWKARAV
jgi:Na+-driven multidrug efflux pump